MSQEDFEHCQSSLLSQISTKIRPDELLRKYAQKVRTLLQNRTVPNKVNHMTLLCTERTLMDHKFGSDSI